MSLNHKRINGPTPHGGDYIDIYYVDDAGKPAGADVATRFIVREYISNGFLLKEIRGQREPNAEAGDETESYLYLLGTHHQIS